MFHPVGPLPAVVYWRRRLLVLILLVALAAGGGWLGAEGLRWSGRRESPRASGTTEPAVPALEQVVPALGGVQARDAAASAGPPAAASPTAAEAAGAPPGPCTDEMIGLTVRAPQAARVGQPATFDLVVTNTSSAGCARALDGQLQEVVLLDGAGRRIWGSGDCAGSEAGSPRVLAPGEAVSLPVPWRGLSSAPACAGTPVAPVPGRYVLRGRLGTKVAPDVPLTLA